MKVKIMKPGEILGVTDKAKKLIAKAEKDGLLIQLCCRNGKPFLRSFNPNRQPTLAQAKARVAFSEASKNAKVDKKEFESFALLKEGSRLISEALKGKTFKGE